LGKDSYQGIAEQAAGKWMFSAGHVQVDAFSHPLSVGFLCFQLNFQADGDACCFA
jgi:hypothetical protein